MVDLVLVYKVFFLTVSTSIFNADSKSEGSQTKYVERFSKNRCIQNGRLADGNQSCMMPITFNILYT